MPALDIAQPDERKGTLASHVYDRLRQDIISVTIPPGEKLHIRSLCERFDVGLSPMREALSRLSRESLVVQNDHRGFSVAQMSKEDLLDITHARCTLNGIAIRNSIEHGDAVWEESVVLAFHRLSRTPRYLPGQQSERSQAWEIAHRNFHSSLIAASGSRRMEAYCEDLFDSAERYRHIGRKAGIKGENRDKEHRGLMEAVVERDADKAVAFITAHFEHTAALVRKVLKARQA